MKWEDLTDEQRATVQEWTLTVPAIRATYGSDVEGLVAPESVELGDFVYVHGSANWRPALIVRVVERAGKTTYTVAHDTVANAKSTISGEAINFKKGKGYLKVKQAKDLRVKA